MTFLTHLQQILLVDTWAWWAAGLGLGLTALGLAWFSGKRLGVTGGFVDICSIASGKELKTDSWKLWFLIGLPLGGVLANIGHWNWTWLYGRLDAISPLPLTGR